MVRYCISFLQHSSLETPMLRPFPALLAAAVAVAVLVLPIRGQQNSVVRDTSPRVLDVQGGKIRVVTVATGLFHPWSLAFVDARTMLVAERNGKLRIVRDGVLAAAPIWVSPGATATSDSLHAVAVHPKFAENNLIYL